eukprot:TRINITY_DN497_c0_g1_i11.p1 TRINITY_DN497_c0_g1~~TRINITY_DN497_c0_g1_i11.p1  ORF type:complete len:501 (-),score=74.50 TRINITY_DN497_c0_g1_i11:800-2302(-)
MSAAGVFDLQPESRRIKPSTLSRPSTSHTLTRPFTSASNMSNMSNTSNASNTSAPRKWSLANASSTPLHSNRKALNAENPSHASNSHCVVGGVVGVSAERKDHAPIQSADGSHSDMRRERLQRIYRGEKGKDSIFAKLKLKFIMPFMEPALQDAISKAIDELVNIPAITMSDIEKLQKRIHNIEKEFRCRNPTVYESRPSTSYSQKSQVYSVSAPSTPGSQYLLHYDMGNTAQAALQWSRSVDESGFQPHALVQEKSRLSESKRQLKDDLLRMSLEKQQRLRELLQQEQEEADRLIVANDIFLLEDENQELRLTNRKLADNESRIDEIVNKIHTQNVSRSQDLREEQERMKELQEELAKERESQAEEARKKQDGLRMSLVENQFKNKEKKESIMRSLEQDKEIMRQYLENYDYQMRCREDYERHQKDMRLARAHAVKDPYSKSIPEKSHEVCFIPFSMTQTCRQERANPFAHIHIIIVESQKFYQTETHLNIRDLLLLLC